MSASRCASVVAFSETASFTGVSSPSRRITGTSPLVETVTWRCEKFGPSSASRRSFSATLRFSKLWSGSPIPMNTRFVSGRGPLRLPELDEAPVRAVDLVDDLAGAEVPREPHRAR